jgi:hypothetical protein
VPLNLAATGGNKQVTLTWDASTAAASYNVYYKAGSTVSTSSYDKKTTDITANTGYVVGSLTDGTQYAFIVTAVNGTLESAASTAATATTYSLVATPTFSPSAGSYSASQSVAITSTTSGATIRYTTNGTDPSGTAGTLYSSAVTVSSATTLRAIAYKTGMVDSAISSAAYTIVAPEAPYITSWMAQSTAVELNWDSPTGTTSYNLYYKQGSTVSTSSYGTKITGATPGEFMSGFSTGTKYTFVVTAVGIGGESAASNLIAVTTIPAAPTVSSAVQAGAGSSTVIVAVTPADAGATSFNLYYAMGDTVSTSSGSTKETSTDGVFTLNLSVGNLYTFVATAINSSGESAASGSVAVRLAITAPTNVTAQSVTSSSVTVSWDSVNGAITYNLYYTEGSFVTTLGSTECARVSSGYTVTGLSSGQQYAFIVTAVAPACGSYGESEGAASTIMTATTP